MSEQNYVTWMTSGASMFEVLITCACVAHDDDVVQNLTVFAQKQSAGDPTVFQSISKLIQGFGAGINADGLNGFGNDLWTSLPLLGLRHVKDGPFVAMDPGTLVFQKNAFDLGTNFASTAVMPQWPEEHLYGPEKSVVWQSVFEFASADLAGQLDTNYHAKSWKHWPHLDGKIVTGSDAAAFAKAYADFSKELLNAPPEAIETQEIRSQLRRIALPVVMAKLGAGPQDYGDAVARFDGVFPANRLAYIYAAAPEAAIDHLEASVAPNPIKKVLKLYEPAKRLIYQGKGRDIRKRFYNPNGQDPRKLMKRLKRNTKFWVR